MAMVTVFAYLLLLFITHGQLHMIARIVSCRRPSNPGRSVAVAVAALGGLLREAPARALFAKSGGVALLAPLLRAGAAGGPGAPGSQLLYEAGLALWQLSFYQPAAAAMGSAGVLPGLVELTRTAPKEKVRPLHAWAVITGQMRCPFITGSCLFASVACEQVERMHDQSRQA